MKILAVDTSSAVATVAVLEDEKLLGEYLVNHKKTHSQKLMPILEHFLKMLELTPKDIDLFAAAVGPGSFTGLRIGVATVKGMAMATDKPTVGVSVLEAMAYNLPFCEHIICPIMDARNNQVYFGMYLWEDGELKSLMQGQAGALPELLEDIKATGQKVVFLGDGVHVYHNTIQETLGSQCLFAPPSCNMQRASSVGLVAQNMQKQGRTTDAAGLLPEYLRKPQAEREREMKG